MRGDKGRREESGNDVKGREGKEGDEDREGKERKREGREDDGIT